ncbi:30S ribosomal protein S21, chloroplastic-like isoform X2 [Olea europaea var. sylvestris]|uniref:30S ribosomal protein S21, chloroplastic-like isoform X1 n=1 Tax=Olea europaea var. sylvestris TaxID=158386 RepID=UPI000C1D4BE2|nr:30S ribosomal protein S21, chloroplastic-like isoform X1 [Olea europaea var. sylvestris]XP_022843502.1 30S ribosomal protein S21, chloroplastic-like isoform X2 [Olea europaea var. sylvestris]
MNTTTKLMAASSTPNLFSFFTPSKQRSAPPSHLSRSSSATAATKDRWAPLVYSSTELQQNLLSLSSSCSSDVMSVVCPSLAYANTLFFRSAYNVQVIVDDNEPEEKLLGRFRREVMRAGVIQECKRRRFFENKQEEKKRKSREAAKRNRRRRPQSRNFTQDRQETPKNKKEEEDDNWDLPEGDLPY